MSTDFFLVSPSRKRAVCIGSTGFSGVQSYPASPDAVEFVRWAIEEFLDDVVMMNEHQLLGIEEVEGWSHHPPRKAQEKGGGK